MKWHYRMTPPTAFLHCPSHVWDPPFSLATCVNRGARSPFLGSHLAASVDGAWVEHKVQHQNYDWKLLTSIGKVMKL